MGDHWRPHLEETPPHVPQGVNCVGRLRPGSHASTQTASWASVSPARWVQTWHVALAGRNRSVQDPGCPRFSTRGA